MSYRQSRTGVDIGIGGFREDICLTALDEGAVTSVEVMRFCDSQRDLRVDQIAVVRPLTRVPNCLRVIDDFVSIFDKDGGKPITCQLTEHIACTNSHIILRSGPDAGERHHRGVKARTATSSSQPRGTQPTGTVRRDMIGNTSACPGPTTIACTDVFWSKKLSKRKSIIWPQPPGISLIPTLQPAFMLRASQSSVFRDPFTSTCYLGFG